MARVEPLSLASLPKAALPRRVRARLPWTWVGEAGHTTTLQLGSLGEVRLSWQGVEPTAVVSSEEFALLDGEGRRGQLTIDRWLALGVVAATLGLPSVPALRRLGPAERGIVAGHLAAALVRWGGRITLALFEPRRALDEARLVALALRVEAVGTSGLVKLDVPYEWLALGEVPASGAPSGAFSTVVGRLPIVASIEIASTDLPLRELDAAGVGDAVVFEGRAALPACDWPVELRIGDYSVGAIARDGGVIVLSGPLRSIRSRGRSPAPAGPVPRVIVRKADVMTPDPDDLNTEVLAAAPVEVVAELGRIVLRGDEVLALERGSVLSVAHQGGRIDLVVGGRPWARGELVNVDGDLGVRVTELVRR